MTSQNILRVDGAEFSADDIAVIATKPHLYATPVHLAALRFLHDRNRTLQREMTDLRTPEGEHEDHGDTYRGIQRQARAWETVTRFLDHVAPGWTKPGDPLQARGHNAVSAYEDMQQKVVDAAEAALKKVEAAQAITNEADRRAGAAERENEGLRDDVRRHNAVRDRMKADWGAHQNTSFDVVWDEALTLKKKDAWLKQKVAEISEAHAGSPATLLALAGLFDAIMQEAAP